MNNRTQSDLKEFIIIKLKKTSVEYIKKKKP